MKIAIPLLGFGKTGGYRVLARLASVWSGWGHEVVMLAHRSSPQPYFPNSCRVLWIDDRGCQSEWTGPRDHGSLVSKCRVMVQLFALQQALTRHFREYDVVLANHSLTAFPVRWCRSAAKRFYYIQAYEPEYYRSQSGWSSRILSRLSALSYQLGLCQIVNGHIYCHHKEIRSRHVVPPGVDETVFHPANGQSQRDPEKFIIGCIGRKEVGKGTRYVADAFRRLSASDKRYVLRVAYGHLPDSCRDMPNVEVVVPKSDAELADYYRSVDVLVAPGTIQLGAFHYPVMEPMACGVPVITTNYAPATAENAWLVPICNSLAIADAIVEISSRPELVAQRVRLAGEAMKPFTWPSVAESMLSIFQEAHRAE